MVAKGEPAVSDGMAARDEMPVELSFQMGLYCCVQWQGVNSSLSQFARRLETPNQHAVLRYEREIIHGRHSMQLCLHPTCL
jgi:hypothetical protein